MVYLLSLGAQGFEGDLDQGFQVAVLALVFLSFLRCANTRATDTCGRWGSCARLSGAFLGPRGCLRYLRNCTRPAVSISQVAMAARVRV